MNRHSGAFYMAVLPPGIKTERFKLKRLPPRISVNPTAESNGLFV